MDLIDSFLCRFISVWTYYYRTCTKYFFLFWIGTLLRRLENGMRGISHVIVDEIHERDINVRWKIPNYYLYLNADKYLFYRRMTFTIKKLFMYNKFCKMGAPAVFVLRLTFCWCCWGTWYMRTHSWGSFWCLPRWTRLCSPSTLGTVRWWRCMDAHTLSRVRISLKCRNRMFP